MRLRGHSGEGTVIKDRFHLTEDRLQAFVIKDLLMENGGQHLMDRSYESFPDSTVV